MLLQALHMCVAFIPLIFILCTFQVIFINSTQFLFYCFEYCTCWYYKVHKWVLKEVCVYPSPYLISRATQWILLQFCICTVLPQHFLIIFHFGPHGSYNVLYTDVMLACERHISSVVEMKCSLLVWYVTSCSLIVRDNYAHCSRATFSPIFRICFTVVLNSQYWFTEHNLIYHNYYQYYLIKNDMKTNIFTSKMHICTAVQCL